MDKIVSKPGNRVFRDNMDRIFGTKEELVNYVLGFVFRNKGGEVALIKKINPEWQRGKLNGIGGKIEIGRETVNDAMCREFKEETGVDLKGWKLFCILKDINNRWKVFIYAFNFETVLPPEIKSSEEGEVNWYPVKELSNLNVIPNLRWLIPMALDSNLEIAEVTEAAQ